MQIVKVMKCPPQEDNNSSFSNYNKQQGYSCSQKKSNTKFYKFVNIKDKLVNILAYAVT